MSARDELSNWVSENVPQEHRSELSKLIAVFVATAIRDDREKQRELETQRQKAKALVDRINDPSGIKRMFEDFKL